MDERTESEIFEEQLNSLYKPLKQTPTTPKSENENNQVLANQNLAKQDLEAEPSYISTISTGIAYLDNKIKNRSITAFDYYMAKKFLGININLNGNLNLKSENKTRLASINKATQDIFDDMKALDLGNDLIQKTQEHSGLINQIKLWINHKTRGFKGVDYDLAQTDNARISYANRLAKTMAQGGQVTQKLRDEAKAMTEWGARSKEENTARISQTQEVLLNSLKKNLQMLESLGGSVSPLMLAKIKEYQDKADYINETRGKIDLKKYQTLKNESQ
ncbi:Coiled-coil domain-containing protein [Helicobacter pylori]|uniref:Coiled-coil domain-containing protein n=1 Tax=Helicobacter pylori TaxID=210 RepID=UPI000992ADB9|nr:Coiled-coil domain-containing protein [Helicobacter pylori]OOP82720.1 Coiled-coil domain-containing protein [Helicobacter pylori]PDX19489.1 Coiled-coil domain-containing protein [Helicobacter pylori]